MCISVASNIQKKIINLKSQDYTNLPDLSALKAYPTSGEVVGSKL